MLQLRMLAARCWHPISAVECRGHPRSSPEFKHLELLDEWFRMAINIVCTGCKKRFSVSEKFAGQEGPCPNCKTVLKIPEREEEVLIHAPEGAGLKDSEGRAVLTPILREEMKFSPKVAVGVGAGVLVVFVVAFLLRGEDRPHAAILVLGALALGPAMAFSGYTFLRNDELEPYRGQELLVRVLACGAAYAFLWGVYWWLQSSLGIEFTVTSMVYVLPPFVLAGGFAALASLELDYFMGTLHYGLYLLVTVLLCFITNVPVFAVG